MSIAQGSALIAIGMQLVEKLDGYEVDLDRLLLAPHDPELYRQISHSVDHMRMLSATLPKLSVCWVELLIRHFELTHGLWRIQQGSEQPGAMEPLREQAQHAARRLRERCLEVVAGLAADGTTPRH
jgi:hypothetical protein